MKEAPEHLPPLSKAKASAIRKLRQAKERRATGQFLIEGVRVAEEALASGVDVQLAVVSPRLASTERGKALQEALMQSVAQVAQVSDRDLYALADTEAPQGVLLVARVNRADLEGLAPKQGALVLDGIQDPGNVGTLIRSAWAFGCGAVVVLPGSADPFGPKAVRASAGGIFHLDVAEAEPSEVVVWSTANGAILLAAATGDDGIPSSVGGPWVLVVGSEGHGVRPEIRDAAQAVAVPMPGGAESLNAAVAGSLLLYTLTDASSG